MISINNKWDFLEQTAKEYLKMPGMSLRDAKECACREYKVRKELQKDQAVEALLKKRRGREAGV